jgi:hypothetical protein
MERQNPSIRRGRFGIANYVVAELKSVDLLPPLGQELTELQVSDFAIGSDGHSYF